MSYLTLSNLNFSYDQNSIVKDFNLSLEVGEFHSLLGESGCGKSTLLHLIAGFLEPSSGVIKINEQNMINVPCEKRGVGIVFQEHCLFPHLNVEENIKYAMKGESFEELLHLIKLEDKMHKYPEELSGGEQQRVAIARTLATKPKLLLLDEPFSSLDQTLREELSSEIKEITQKINLTTLLVTHSIEEAVELSERVTVLKCDRSYQTDIPLNLPRVVEHLERKISKINASLKK